MPFLTVSRFRARASSLLVLALLIMEGASDMDYGVSEFEQLEAELKAKPVRPKDWVDFRCQRCGAELAEALLKKSGLLSS